ncbi:MAG TPA: HlyD family efflux transporter periplasmic adaptor subunit [Tenuifilaceae bacterium]|nr:HlyD family efflux transporter periplasmic adaptor subunit [Tenuifilaceae bacterium]
MQQEKINIKSDEITEILGTPPRWIVRWGITVIFLVIGVVFVGSFFFSYPDTVIAPVTITSENPPSVVVARATGKPAAIFVSDGEKVFIGDTLGVIENPANYRDVFYLSKFFSKYVSNDFLKDSTQDNLLPKHLVLGDIQSVYNSFSKATNDLHIFRKLNYYPQKISALEAELHQYQIYYDRQWSQRNLTVKDLKITQQQFNRDSSLFSKGVIAAVEFEKSQAILISKRQALENSRLNLSNTAITIEKLKQNIVDTKLEFESQRLKLEEDFANSLSQLTSSLASWSKIYVLTASSSGKLNFMSVWSDQQEVKAGDALFSITPDSVGEIQARMVIPFERAGKVKQGQRVNIKLDGYSYLEFGMVEARVASISSGYNDKGFPALATLPNGLKTNYNTNIPFDRELLGTAEITTEDITLLQRLFSPLKHIYKSRIQKEEK